MGVVSAEIWICQMEIHGVSFEEGAQKDVEGQWYGAMGYVSKIDLNLNLFVIMESTIRLEHPYLN